MTPVALITLTMIAIAVRYADTPVKEPLVGLRGHLQRPDETPSPDDLDPVPTETVPGPIIAAKFASLGMTFGDVVRRCTVGSPHVIFDSDRVLAVSLGGAATSTAPVLLHALVQRQLCDAGIHLALSTDPLAEPLTELSVACTMLKSVIEQLGLFSEADAVARELDRNYLAHLSTLLITLVEVPALETSKIMELIALLQLLSVLYAH